MKSDVKNYLVIRSVDIFKKLFLFFALIGIYLMFLNIDDISSYGADTFNFKTKNHFFDFIDIIFIAFGTIFIYFLYEVFLNSKYNRTKFEIFIYNLLNKIPKFEINSKIYTTVIIMLYAFTLYYILVFIRLAYISTQLIANVDYLTMEPITQSVYTETNLYLIPIVLFFSFFMLTKPNKNVNEDIINGFHLYLFVSLILNGKNGDLFLKEYDSHFLFNLLSSSTLALIFVICLLYILNFQKLSLKEITKKSLYFILGYWLMSLLIIGIYKFSMIDFKKEYIDSNLNDRVLSINGNDYNYNTSLLLIHKDQEDNPDFEYLIESYAGQSMHRTLNLFDYIFSKDFKGDKERSYQLFAKIYEKNSIVMKNNEEKAFKLLNNGVSTTDYFSIVMPYIIYESSPYESTRKTMENILNKDYQAAVDNYIEYGLNNDMTVISKFTKKERENKGFVGSPVYQSLIYSLVSNGYAKFDLEKVKNDKYKEIWKNRLQKNNTLYEKYSEEKVEKWFKTFGV